MMLNSPRSHPPANGCSDNKRDGFIGDSKSLILILQTPSDKQWGSHFTDLKNQLRVEFAEMPNDIRVSKVFATLRGLCLGPEVAMSLNEFERKYYDMEYRIKSQKKNGHSRSNSSESTVDLAIECVLDENSSAELSDVVDLDHIFSPKNSKDEEVQGTGYSTPRKHQSTYGHREPNDGVGYLDGDASSSPYSDSTVLRPKCHNQTYPRPVLPRSSSTHYLSPSALSSPTILRLEAFSPILSPVRENKSVEEIWRDESLYLAPLPRTPKGSGSRPPSPPSPPPRAPTNEAASRLPPSYQKTSPAFPPESPKVIRKKRYIILPQSGSSSILRPRMNIGQDKALPLIPQISSSPDLKRESSLATLKNRSSSGPPSLRGDPKQPMIARLRSSRTPSVGILPLSPAVTIRKNYPKPKIAMNKTCERDCRSFASFGSRTPTPTSRVADNRIVQDKHRSMERETSLSYISIKTSRTTVSESPVKTAPQYSQPAVSTPPTKATAAIRPELSVLNSDFDSNPERPGRCSNRTSITPSLLSSPGRGDSFRSGCEIYEDKTFCRENSAASTILSAATNSTGDIPNLALGISFDSSVRRVPGTPRLIEVTKNVYGGSCVVPLEKGAGAKQPRIVCDTSTRGTMSSMKSVNMIDKVGIKAHPLVSEAEKADSTIQSMSSYGSATRIPSSKHPDKKAPLYENDPKAKYSPRKGSKRYIDAIQGGLDGTKKEPELKKHSGQNTGTKEVPEALISRTSPKSRIHGTTQKLAIGRPDGRQQKDPNTGAKSGGMGNSASSFVGSNQRVSSTGNGIGQKNASASGVERNYMRPLAKDKLRQSAYSPPSRTQPSGNLPALPKPPSRPGGQLAGNRRVEQAISIDRRSSNSLRGQRTIQDTISKDKPLTTVGTKNGSTASLNDDPKVDTARKLAISPTVIESLSSPTNSKKSAKDSVLADITGIGCGINPRTKPISSRNWFGRRCVGGAPTITGPIGGPFIHLDSQKENARPYMGSNQQYLQPTAIAGTPKSKSKSLGNLASWLSRGSPKPSPTERGSFLKGTASRKTKGKYSPLPLNGQFSQDEVDNLIKRLSAQIPQTPNEKNGFNALGGRYYTLNIPSLDRSPSKDEKDSNPIAVCMDLINAASNEPQSPRRERLLQMSRVMVDAVSKSRDAECAAEEAKMAARRAEVAFLETRRHLAEMAGLMKNRKTGYLIV